MASISIKKVGSEATKTKVEVNITESDPKKPAPLPRLKDTIKGPDEIPFTNDNTTTVSDTPVQVPFIEAIVTTKPLEPEESVKTSEETTPVEVVNVEEDKLNKDKYEGDRVDLSPPLDNGKWEVIKFESPFELIYTIDRHLNSGRVLLHGWQVEELESLSTAKPTQYAPHREALCAANGSGKDKYIIAPFVIWFALTKVRSLTIITSSSGTQLTAQTENYIASLARDINTFYGRPIFKITRRFIKCLKSGSEIRMFATDEAGKAEGYHPLEPDSEMAIIVNEAKSVVPDIFGALSRCTGYNYWLNVSTPGEPIGDFHDSFYNWPITRRVTAFDCPHLPPNHITEVKRKYGETSAIYRSQILAEFTAVGGQCVINQDFLNACVESSLRKLVKPIVFGRKRIGVDLAAGRDECAFVVSYGNRVIDREFFVEGDTTITESRLETFIIKHGGSLGTGCDVFADDGGIGHAIIDRLVSKGYNITRVLNQSRAFDYTQFGNRGAEMWFNFARLVEEKLIILDLDLKGPGKEDGDKKLYKQLAYRHYKKNETSGRITLESKKEAKDRGEHSPDRADAYILSFCGTDLDEITKAIKDAAPEPKPLGMSIQQLFDARASRHRELIMGTGNMIKEPVTNNSIETLMASKKYGNN